MYHWFMNGSTVNSNSRISLNATTLKSTLTFSPLRTSDGGVYQCMAEVTVLDTDIVYYETANIRVIVSGELHSLYSYRIAEKFSEAIIF